MKYVYNNKRNAQIGFGEATLATGGALAPVTLIIDGAIALLPVLIPWISNAFKHPARDANNLINALKPKLINIDPRERLGLVLAAANKISYDARDVMAEKLFLWYKTNYPNDYKILLVEDKEFYNNFLANQINSYPDGNNFWANSKSSMFTNSEVNYNATPIKTITNLFQPSGSNQAGISPIFLLAIVGGGIFLLTRKKKK